MEAERAAAQSHQAGLPPRRRPLIPMAPTGASLPGDQLWPEQCPGCSRSAALPAAGCCQPGQGGQNLGNLFYQIQQLQQEVMRLNGKVEEQAHELRNLKEQSLQRYVDLDKRLSAGGRVLLPRLPVAAPAGSAAPVGSAASPVTSGAPSSPGKARPIAPPMRWCGPAV